jgi:rhamnose transport system ATP-binding protein
MRARARRLLDRDRRAKIDPDALRELGIANKHLVAIARALSIDARVVIMDEPTAALSHKEIEELYDLVERLKAPRQGDPVHQPQVRRDLPHRRPLYRVPRRAFVGEGLIAEVTTTIWCG